MIRMNRAASLIFLSIAGLAFLAAPAFAQSIGSNSIASSDTSIGEQIVQLLDSPGARMVVITAFFLSLTTVLHVPGHGVPETCGLIALILMLGVPMMRGHAQWWEILAIFIGLGLVSLEILLPGYLLPGLLGGALVVGGLIMTFVPKSAGGLPTLFATREAAWNSLGTGVFVVAGAMASSLIIWTWLSRYLSTIPYFNRLVLSTPDGDTSAKMVWPPVGALGKALTDLHPGGSAEFFDGQSQVKRPASVVSEGGFVPAGSAITVYRVDGPSVIVRAAV
jgi:membrane-bound serine protease (ClpP class)